VAGLCFFAFLDWLLVEWFWDPGYLYGIGWQNSTSMLFMIAMYVLAAVIYFGFSAYRRARVSMSIRSTRIYRWNNLLSTEASSDAWDGLWIKLGCICIRLVFWQSNLTLIFTNATMFHRTPRRLAHARWEHVPAGASSFVLIVDDPDARRAASCTGSSTTSLRT